jgi:hypothetical protein
VQALAWTVGLGRQPLKADGGIDEIAQDQPRHVRFPILRDPSQVQFRNVQVVGGHKLVCGEFNATNQYGAFEGYEPFAYFESEEGPPQTLWLKVKRSAEFNAQAYEGITLPCRMLSNTGES